MAHGLAFNVQFLECPERVQRKSLKAQESSESVTQPGTKGSDVPGAPGHAFFPIALLHNLCALAWFKEQVAMDEAHMLAKTVGVQSDALKRFAETVVITHAE